MKTTHSTGTRGRRCKRAFIGAVPAAMLVATMAGPFRLQSRPPAPRKRHRTRSIYRTTTLATLGACRWRSRPRPLRPWPRSRAKSS